MNRREALTRVALVCGGAVVGAEAFLSGCSRAPEEAQWIAGFDRTSRGFLNEVAETILPSTAKGPGAKEADVASFMAAIVSDCYDADEQAVFGTAIPEIRRRAEERFGSDFMRLDAGQRHELLVALDAEARSADDAKADADVPHYFSLVKQLTLWGFFTSEVGSKQALRYNPVPGRYEGCIEYRDGDRAWAAI